MNYHWHVCTFEKERRKERMLNLVKKNKKKKIGRKKRNKERHSVDESGVQILWGVPWTSLMCVSLWKACWRPGTLQYVVFPRPSRSSSTHLCLIDTPLLRGRENQGFPVNVEKKQGRVEGGMSGGNPRHRVGPLVRPKSYYSFNPSRVSQPLSLSWTHRSKLNTWGEAPFMDVSGLLEPLPVFNHSYITCQWVSG